MIPQEIYHGGALGIVASTVLTPFSPSVILCSSASAINVDLPNPSMMTNRDRGFSRFTVINKGTGSVSIRTHSGSTLTTVVTNQGIELFLGNTAFHFRTKTLATPRSIGASARGSVLSDSRPTTYSTPNCFLGSDCDFADFNGNVPLDGEDGRAKCVVPMCQDVVAFCENASREPIRAADVVMPSVVVIRLSRADFTPDPAHPLSSTVLPEEFYTALFDGKPVALIYDNKAVGARSRHPHHLRWQGSPTPLWGHGSGIANFTVSRHTWKKVIPYSSGGLDYEIDIRFVAEHTLSGGNEANVDPTGTPGGTMNRDYGAWGTLFSLYVFCNQLSPSFVDGDSFTPVDSSGPVSFTKADPFVSGIAYGVGESAEDKFCHPQLVVVAHFPTTFQSPMGHSHVVLEDRQFVNGILAIDEQSIRGKNLEFEHKLRNGSPWIDYLSDPGVYPRSTVEDADIFGNIVFGWTISTKSSAAMTLGGGFPTSTPTNFFVWENGLGVGRTYLVPEKPGWDELSGELDVLGGSSGSVSVCMGDGDGIPGENGVSEWPFYEFEECTGHPTEPFEGAGGGHLCFNNANDLDGPIASCCTQTSRQAYATVVDKCKVVGTVYGDFSGIGCELLEDTCTITQTKNWRALLDYENHEYFMNGNQLLRNILFAKPILDPSLVFGDYTHEGSIPNPSLFVPDYGTWSLNTITPSGINAPHASNIKALARYINATTPVQEDVIITAQFRSAATVAQGLGGKVTVSSGMVSGYFAVIQPTGGTNATVSIRKYVSDTETILATRSITNLSSSIVDVEFDVWGCLLKFTWTVSGQDTESLSVEDATFSSSLGEAALAIAGVGTGVFADIFIDDEKKNFIRIEATQGCYANGLSWPETIPEERVSSLAECNAILTNPECGSCCHSNPDCNPICFYCNCSSEDGTPIYITSFSWSGLSIDNPSGGDISLTNCSGPNDYSGGGENPTYVGGPLPRCDCYGQYCAGTNLPKCGLCPDPFVNGEVLFPMCWPASLDQDDMPRMCRGLRNWFYSDAGCA